jgi:hypothetical protein
LAVDGSTTDANGDAIIISISEPYLNVVEIITFEDEIKGESTACFYDKYFRWGIDGVTYSDWVPLTDINLEALLLDPNKPFWIQYKYVQVGDCTLEFESIALELVTDGGIIQLLPQLVCCDGQSMTGCMNLVVNCCEDSWNPYDLSRAQQQYELLSTVASNLFGFCVKYFKTEADQRSRDVILKEYSLFDVIDVAEVKILVPDNELPTRDIQFNPLMMDWPIEFEVHIVRAPFQAVFGAGSKPQMHDYMYFEQFLNRMYEVNAVAEPDDFMYTNAYWRVSLVQYQDRTAVMYPDKNIEEEKDDLITSVEEAFGEEAENEFRDVRKPNQYNTIGTQANDYVRRILDKRLIIKEEKVYNAWTIVAKYHYALDSMDKGDETVEYRYKGGWTINDDRAFTNWIRPQYNLPIGVNTLITTINNIGGKASFTIGAGHTYKISDWVKVEGTTSYNGIQKIIAVGTTSITIDDTYSTNTFSGTPRVRLEKNCTYIVYEGESQRYFSLTFTPNWYIIEINSTYYKYDLSAQGLSLNKDNWYAVCINASNSFDQLSLFIYETEEQTGLIDPNITADLKLRFSETKDYPNTTVPNNHAWKLLAADTDLTNIRIFTKPIEEEEQNVVLSQYVVNDTHLTELVDNASPQLRLPRVTNPR